MDEEVSQSEQALGTDCPAHDSSRKHSLGKHLRHAQFAVFSDPHVYDSALGTEGPAFEANLQQDRKMLVESESILQTVVARIIDAQPDFVLVPGDLTKDGELVNHRLFAKYLRQIERAGIEAFVVPGNHDVRNPDAVAFTATGTEPTASTSERDFRRIYHQFGYGQALDRDSESLSYLAEPAPGVWLLALDSTRHRENTEETGPVTAGRLAPATKAWALSKIGSAKRQGKRLIAMMHHGIVDHFSSQRLLFPEYVIEDADTLAKDFADAGLEVVFTGHFHANDMTSKEFENGSKITDIETGSLVTYPSPVRMVDFNLVDRTMAVTTEPTTTLPGWPDFGSYASTFLNDGLRSLVTYTLMSSGEVDAATAQALAPVIAGAFAAHYAGEEPAPSATVLGTAAMLSASGTMMGQVWSSTLVSLYSDLAPVDNNETLQLRKKP